MKSIVILGGGPAGLALAAGLLARDVNYKVTIIEKTKYDNIFPGEHVQSHILPLFQSLNIPKNILFENSTPCHGVIGTWANRSLNSESIFNLYGDDFIVHRPDFEKALATFLKAHGVRLHIGITPKRIENGVIHTSKEILPYDFLFDCTGRTSRQFNNQRIIFDNLLGISYYEPSKSDGDSEIIIESQENGWWYHTSSRKMRITTFFTDCDHYNLLKKDLQSELNKTDITKKYCKTLTGKPHHKLAFTSILKLTPWDIYQVGDSFLSLDPLSSQGIFKAFKQASQVADCLSTGNFKEAISVLYAKEKDFFYDSLKIRERYYREGWCIYRSNFYKKRCELSLT